MHLAGKKALITGAGAGIGRAIASRFAREGAQVVVSDIDAAAGADVAEAIRHTDQDYGIPFLELIQARQGRLVTVDAVAAAAVFLASDESSFVNGHALVLDNGAATG